MIYISTDYTEPRLYTSAGNFYLVATR